MASEYIPYPVYCKKTDGYVIVLEGTAIQDDGFGFPETTDEQAYPEEGLPDGWADLETGDLDEARRLAALFLEIDNFTRGVFTISEDEIELGRGQTYRALSESEAEDAYEKWCNNFIDEALMPQVPPSLQPYFDRDKFIEDSLRADGRGTLASYDGHERCRALINPTNEEQTTYYLYRTR